MTQSEHDTEPLGNAIRAAVADVRAPAPLRVRIEAEREARHARRRRMPVVAVAGAAAVMACSAVLVLVIGVLGGEADRFEGPTMALAANAALRPATGAAPEEDERNPVLVRAGINGLRFPYWDDEFGLKATALRRETIGGRRAMTVVYGGRGQRIGYTIVAGAAIPVPDDAQAVRRGSLPLAVFQRSGATIVTWRRSGHTCVLASRQADARRLLQLAAWTGGGRIAGYHR
jgi:hypothetical protein